MSVDGSTMHYVLIIVVLCVLSGASSTRGYVVDPEEDIIQRIVKECSRSPQTISCYSNKAAKALERAMDWDLPLFDGFTFARNQQKLMPFTEARAQKSGFSRLIHTLRDFLKTHTLTLDLSENEFLEEDARELKGERGGGTGYGGSGYGSSGFGGYKGGKGGKGMKKGGYMKYTFMVLMGIFGLTGPIIMKILAIMAAKALIASKMAMMIAGSVALKKIFEKDHYEPKVKVHTINTGDDHDRIYKVNPNLTPYWGYGYEPHVKQK